jgi:Lrp/AsnC family transcriptional regulator, regulator for asnA, asnC and gidA
MESRIDDIDARIITFMQTDPRASYATIGRAIGVSETTVKRRLEALLADKVISPAIIIDPRLLGYGATAILLLKVEPRHINDVAERLCTLPEVGYLALAVGHYDIMMYVIQRTVADMNEFITGRIAQLPGVTAVESVLTPRFLKVFAGWRGLLDEAQQAPSLPSEDGVEENHSADSMLRRQRLPAP